MKKVWISIIAIATTVAMVSSAFAQSAGPKTGAPGQGIAPGQKGKPGQGGQGGMRRGKMQQDILAKLNLTPAQKTKIEGLQAAFRKKMEAMRPKDGQQGRPDQAQMEKFRAMFKAHNESIMAVLTPAQKTKFETMMAEMRAKRGQKGGPGKPGVKPPATGKTGKPGKPGTKPPTI